jgi:hypothetical protein
MGARPTAWILVALSLLLVPVAVLAQPEVGALAIEQGGPRPYPPAATTFRFTGLAADNQTVLYGPVSLPAQTNTLLSDVPVTVEILKIGYFTGDDLIAGFDGYVTVRSASTTVLQNPPWVTVGACHVPVPDEDGLFGALLAEFGRTPTLLVLPPRALPFGTGTQSPVALPRRVELTNLPPVGMQGTIAHLGSPGSCISWSFAYGLGSYTAARGPDGTIRWNPSEPQNQVSSAFMYALIHALEGKQCPTGSSEGYLTGLVLDGAPSMADVPYAPDCCYINGIDVEQTFPMEARFRIGSFGSIPLPAENPNADPVKTLARLKEFLAAGHAIAFAGPVFAGFSAPAFDDGVFYPTSWCESTPAKPCGHGMLLVGYDDDIGDAQKGRGAFLVQNSFGTNWPPASSNSPAPPGPGGVSARRPPDDRRAAPRVVAGRARRAHHGWPPVDRRRAERGHTARHAHRRAPVQRAGDARVRHDRRAAAVQRPRHADERLRVQQRLHLPRPRRRLQLPARAVRGDDRGADERRTGDVHRHGADAGSQLVRPVAAAGGDAIPAHGQHRHRHQRRALAACPPRASPRGATQLRS